MATMTSPQSSRLRTAGVGGPSILGGGQSRRGLTRFVAATLFIICSASTFISYRPYQFVEWDDAEYLVRSIAVSRAFWAGDVKSLGEAMVSIRPPAMTLLALPWGPLKSWDAVGNCFITLAALISLLIAVSLYLLLRIGVEPLFLAGASVCVGLSLGPFPSGSFIHTVSTAFMADGLFGWIALSALLLIPYEARVNCPTIPISFARGSLWGVILALGVMTKLNFLYFVAAILPVLMFLRFSRSELRNAIACFIGCVCCSAPSALYLFRYGKLAFWNAKASSFGPLAQLYDRPLLTFLSHTLRQSPGLGISLLLTASVLVYLVIKKRIVKSWPDLAAFLITMGFAAIVLTAPNKQIRYLFPAIVVLPFLTAILASGKEISVAPRPATLGAVLIFVGLILSALPMRYRPDSHSLDRPNAILAAADRSNATSIVLATDSPTLNGELMALSALFSSRSYSTGTLAYRASSGVPLEDDFRTLAETEVVVFQDPSFTGPRFTNQRVREYEEYLKQSGDTPTTITSDVYAYFPRGRQHPVIHLRAGTGP